MDLQYLGIQLLIKLGVATAVASALGRAREFKKLLFRRHRSLRQTILLVLFTCIPFALGVYFRFRVKNFEGADLGFEASILIGVMGGRLAGLLGGLLLAMPTLFNGEFLTLPVDVTAGLVAGVLHHVCRNEEEIWTFSPFMDMSVYRWFRRNLRHPRVDWQTAFFLIIIALQAGRLMLQYAAPKRLWALYLPSAWGLLFVFACVVATISIPIKIWNNARIEMKLEEQERLLLEARLDALQSQINPHFLFFHNLGVGFNAAFRANQNLYQGQLPFRPFFYDVDAVYAPPLGKRAQLEFSAGIGAESVRFYTPSFQCSFTGCTNFVSSNHFLGQFGAGFRLYVTPKIFIRPEAHLYEVHNNVEFSGSRATRFGVSIGYSFKNQE